MRRQRAEDREKKSGILCLTKAEIDDFILKVLKVET